VEIIVNDQPCQAPDAATVAELLQQLGLAGRQVAVEVNLELVPHGLHDRHRLAAGDRLEIVTLVGGG
jgi:thiamine biosynthesis protein ThiS